MRSTIAFLFAIVIGAATALGVVSLIAVLSGCSADWNKPHPIIPEEGNPCGIDWHSCGGGLCCYVSDDCRPGGYCAFGGIQGPSWGSRPPDAGAGEYLQQTPSQIYRRRGY